MKKRTLLSMLLMIVMAVSLVGCGDDGKSNDNNSNVADLFNPTTSDTAINETTNNNTGDPVTPYVPGASGPTNSQVETPTPEPEKNVITLMSADGSKAIHEFDIPEGYTVVSDKKSNHVELAKDGDDTIKVEIIPGPCAEALSTIYQYKGITSRNIFCGPAGSGKTYIWNIIKEKLYPHVIIADASTMTKTGWSGSNKISSPLYQINRLSERKEDADAKKKCADTFPSE